MADYDIPDDLSFTNEDEWARREGNNVVYDLYISFMDAALGNPNIEVPTLDGRVKIKIEPGTQSGRILRLRGKGVPEINTNRRGDQLICVNVWTPRELSSEERAQLERLRQSPNFSPRPTKADKNFFERVREAFS